MAGIFTRPKVIEILQDEALTPDERLDRIMSLRGKDLDDGYVTKAYAKESTQTAIEQAKQEWEKNAPKPNIKETDEYKSLLGEYSAYKTKQEAKSSDTYKDVLGKYFDTVYDMVDKSEGANSAEEQLSSIKEKYPELFVQPLEKNTPQYSKQPGHTGTNQVSEEDELFKQLSDNWR